MSPAARQTNNVNFVLWCAVNSRPFNMARDAGFSLFVGQLDYKYAVQTVADSTIDKILSEEHEKLRAIMIAEMRTAKERFTSNGEPFFCAQLDLTTTFNRSFVTFGVTFTDAKFNLRRRALATQVMVGQHTASRLDFIIEVQLSLNSVFRTLC
jgi:hypothetical protein